MLTRPPLQWPSLLESWASPQGSQARSGPWAGLQCANTYTPNCLLKHGFMHPAHI